jgi:cell cycle checkpoint protein
MDSSLHEVWQAAAGSPFFPAVSKGSQFWVGFLLTLLGFSLLGVFALSMRHRLSHLISAC